MRKFLWLVAIAVLMNGCAPVQVQNARESKLMPDKVAKEVLSKYFGNAWVENPIGKGLGMRCSHDDYPMPYKSIKGLLFIHVGDASTLIIRTFNGMALGFTCGDEVQTKAVKNYPAFSDEEVNDIADALVSLGAQIKEIEHK